MKKFNFKIEAGDQNVGTAYIPDTKGVNCPVVIYCHGWPGTRRLEEAGADLCERLTSRGAALVTFDFFASGETGGSQTDFSFGRWAFNLNDVFDWVASQSWADPDKIGIWGFSAGSSTALRFAAQHPKPRFVVSIGSLIGLCTQMPNPPGKVLVEQWDKAVAGGPLRMKDTEINLEFFKDFIAGQPVHFLHQIKCPVFFLEGSADNPYRRTDGLVS